ncbi:nucleotide disphospho-sugar-binding domain-containing protein [Dactylosporangium sp. NPDC049140]|uniref:glycosyltransferase n=1 Tax=Dactylosporangium sp. NPDC049140 TaxID=3155647 RepID=UPI0033D4A531
MRILFSACPLSGHVATILPLALAARAAGHEVVVATGAGVLAPLLRHRLETWPVGTPEAGLPGGGTTAQRSAFFANSAAGRAEDLIPRARDWPPDLVISDTAEVAGVVAAAVTGARHVVHGLGIMPPMVLWNAYAVHLDGLLTRWGIPATADAVREATYLDVCPPALRRPGEPIWTRTLDLRPTTAGWGAPHPAASPRQLTADLDSGSRRQLTARIDALPHRDTVLARPGSPAEAAAILSALDGHPINLVMCADPADLGPQPPNVLVTPGWPDPAVLSRCHVLVSRGGPGVALPALAHGLPQLILSLENTAPDGDMTHAGAALTVNAPDPAAVERAVRTHVPRLLKDPIFAAAAAWAQVEIAAMSSPEAVVRALTTEGVPALR